MNELTNKLDDFLSKNNFALSRHSYFQMKYLILGKEPTVQGKMWQCLRELKRIQESLQAVKWEVSETEDNIALIELDVQDVLKEKNIRNEIMARKYERKKQALAESLKLLDIKKQDLEEEAKFYLLAFESLNKHQKCLPQDDEAAQLDYWNEKFSQKLNMKAFLHDKIDIDTAESIFALPSQSTAKKQLIATIEQKQQALLDQKEKKINAT